MDAEWLTGEPGHEWTRPWWKLLGVIFNMIISGSNTDGRLGWRVCVSKSMSDAGKRLSAAAVARLKWISWCTRRRLITEGWKIINKNRNLLLLLCDSNEHTACLWFYWYNCLLKKKKTKTKLKIKCRCKNIFFFFLSNFIVLESFCTISRTNGRRC